MNKAKKKAFTGFGVLLSVFLGLAVFLFFTVKIAQVDGVSMLPTLKNGQRVLVSKAYWLVGPVRRNDIVVLRDTSPGAKPGAFIIKRVKYLGGETVPFVDEPEYHRLIDGPFTVPKGDLYVMGDNRPQSEDSRKFGPILIENVLGKVVIWR